MLLLFLKTSICFLKFLDESFICVMSPHCIHLQPNLNGVCLSMKLSIKAFAL